MLIVTLLGVSSSSTYSASPTPSPSSSSSTPSASTSAVHDTTASLVGIYHDYRYKPLSSDGEDTFVFPDADFKAGCRFVAQGRTYDLCPLAALERVVEVNQYNKIRMANDGKGKGKAIAGREYRVTLGGMLRAEESDPESCPDGTWVCSKERVSTHTRITPIMRSSEEESSVIYVTNFVGDGREFDLRLRSGKMGARIVLTCDNEEELGYEDDSGGLLVLRWHTRHACPMEFSEGITVTEAEDEQQAPDGEEQIDSPEEDLREGDLPVGGVSKRWLGVVVLLVGCTLTISSVLISSPRARHYAFTHLQAAGYSLLPILTNIKQLTKPVSKHFPHFRGGENRLVRWAQEDMALNGDEDFMVNGSGTEHGWSDLGEMGEYVPLKASPVLGKAMGSPAHVSGRWSYSTYGSTAFEGLDVDDSEVDLGPASEGSVRRFIREASGTATMRVKGLFRR